MSPLSWQRLVSIGLGAVVLAAVGVRAMLAWGVTPMVVPWTVLGVSAAAGVLALWLGWQVRRYVSGDGPRLDLLRAARTAVYAQACAYVGAALAGAYGGYALGLMDAWAHGPRRAVIISALVAAVGGVLLAIAGAVAEHWCRHRDDDDEDGAAPSPA